MKASVWGFLFLVLGILGIVLINFFGNLTVSNEQNYYLLKEITEAAMIDAVDNRDVKEGKDVRIIKEKFVESFVMRFASSAERNKKYQIRFDDINECPPKVTVTLVSTEPYSFFDRILGNNKDIDYQSGTDIVNRLSAILENKE